jgi:hypothetical protein
MASRRYRTRELVFLFALLANSAGVQSQETSAPAAASANLLENSSFEAGSQPGEAPPGWQLWTDGETGYRIERAPGGHTGERSLMVDGAGVRGVVFARGVPIDRTKRYALRGWVKFQGAPGARALILFHYFHDGKWLGLPDAVGVAAATNEWQLVTKTDRAAEVPDASMIWVSCTLEGQGRAWFDDVELVAYDRDNLPADFDAKFGAFNQPVELAILARRVGVWDSQTTIKPGVWNPQGSVTSGTETVEWRLGNKILASEVVEQPGNVESLTLETYDPQSAA